MKRATALLLLALFFPSIARARTAVEAGGSSAETWVISGATLIDGTGAAPVPDAVVVIEGDRITGAGPRAAVVIPDGARILDARGRWLVPGLVDAHVHFFQSGGLYTRPDVVDLRGRVPYDKELAWIKQRLPYTFTRYLASGITAVVDVGGPMWNFEVRELAQKSEAAPRVAVAGPLVSTYAPPNLATDDPAIIAVKDEVEARALVRREIEKKPDLVKIWFIRLPGSKLEDDEKLVKATVEESHSHGVRVAVHATQLDTAKASVRSGCDVLVHSVDDKPVDDEFLKLVKKGRVIYTTTLVVHEGYDEVLGQEVSLTDVEKTLGDPEVIATWSDIARIPKDELPATLRQPRPARSNKVMLENLKKVEEAGIIVAAGTDAGNIGTLHGPSLHRELELMAQAGLTPMQILVAATQNAAHVFSASPEFGTIEVGKLADLVLLTADPLADIKNARKIEKVVKSGRLTDLASIAKLPESPTGPR